MLRTTISNAFQGEGVSTASHRLLKVEDNVLQVWCKQVYQVRSCEGGHISFAFPPCSVLISSAQDGAEFAGSLCPSTRGVCGCTDE